MGEPRPTFFEAYTLGFAHRFRGFSLLCLVVVTLVGAVDLIDLVRHSDFRFLAPLIGGTAAAYAICGLFIWGSTAFIRAMGRQVRRSGRW
jgi:hypothetical protein